MTENPDYPLSNIAPGTPPGGEFRTQGNPAVGSTITLDLGSLQPVHGYYLLTGTAGGGNRPGTPILESSTTSADGSWQQRTFNSSQSVNDHTLATPVDARYLRLRLTTTATGFFGMRYFAVYTTTGWAERPLAPSPVEKASNEFRFQNFSCVYPRIVHGRATVLQWDGTPHNTEYYLSWDDAPAKRLTDLPARPPLTTPTHELTHTTTFVLNAQTKNAAGQTVHHYLSTTVAVRDPDILAKTLTAADKVDVHDMFVADRTNTNSTWARATTFDGDVTIT